MSRRQQREAKLLAAATRRAFFILALSAVVVAALFWVVLLVPPQISPEQLAASIKAQRVRKLTIGSPGTAASLQTGPASTAVVSKEIASPTKSDPSHCSPVSFEQLSGFRFFVTDEMVDKGTHPFDKTKNCLAQIPDEVRALNNKYVSVSGFMLPMKCEGRLATEFLLLRNQSLCCYGKPARITEWVIVRVDGKGVKPIMDVPVTVSGAFHVGDVRENGELVGVYSLDAQRVQGPGE